MRWLIHLSSLTEYCDKPALLTAFYRCLALEGLEIVFQTMPSLS